MAATHHVPLKPKSDLALFYGVARILIERGWLDEKFVHEHTNGFDEFRQHVESFTLETVIEKTGLSREKIEEFARLIHEGGRVSFWWTMGVNQGHEAVAHGAGDHQSGALMTGKHRAARAPGRIRSPASATRWDRGCLAMHHEHLSVDTTLRARGHGRDVAANFADPDPATIPDRQRAWSL